MHATRARHRGGDLPSDAVAVGWVRPSGRRKVREWPRWPTATVLRRSGPRPVHLTVDLQQQLAAVRRRRSGRTAQARSPERTEPARPAGRPSQLPIDEPARAAPGSARPGPAAPAVAAAERVRGVRVDSVVASAQAAAQRGQLRCRAGGTGSGCGPARRCRSSRRGTRREAASARRNPTLVVSPRIAVSSSAATSAAGPPPGGGRARSPCRASGRTQVPTRCPLSSAASTRRPRSGQRTERGQCRPAAGSR